MKRSLILCAFLIAGLSLAGSPRARAQSASPGLIPGPGNTIFPLNQPQLFQYTDPQGTGSITFVDLGVDQTTGFDLLQVTINQNGFTYNGSGIASVIPGAARPLTDLVTFTVISQTGVPYFFEGKMGLGVEFQGQGTYHPVSAPTQLSNWGLLFVPGNPGPGPQPATLSLSIDRGCGSVYPLGASMILTYRSSINDTLTLTDQRRDSTYALFTNVPVLAGQTYAIYTSVSLVPGLRNLTLTDSSGASAVCSFTGQ